METPRTLQQAIVYFSDPDRCFEYACKLRWPDGHITCPRCNSDKHYPVKTKTKKGEVRRLWLCRGCNKQFTVKVGTIFEDSALGMDKWMTAFWMLCNCKNGVSSMEIHRTLGISQKSAWFMLQRLRLAMQDSDFGGKLGGPNSQVEIDETFIGGSARNMHKRRRERIRAIGTYNSKTAVMGILERGGKIKTRVIGKRVGKQMCEIVRENVLPGTPISSDEFSGYYPLREQFAHNVINHLEKYVDGQVHTNGLENFWSLLKRGLGGTYVSVEPFHLFRYVDEQVFRFNNRKNMNDAQRFALGMSQVFGKRLTYSALTGKNESPRHEPTGTGEAQQVPF